MVLPRQKTPFAFDDSVPGTPFSKFVKSPRYNGAKDHFDRSMLDSSFSMHESGNSPQAKRFTQFDSISSNRDFGNNLGSTQEKFSRFDPTICNKDFGYKPNKFSRFDCMSSNKDFGYNPETLIKFDSMSSNKDFGFGGGQGHARYDSVSGRKDYNAPFSFDESNPFSSSSPFKVSSEN